MKFSLEWAGDGQHLLVSAESASGSSLWMASAGGADPVLLEAPWKRPGPVRVSPDGDWLAFSHEQTKDEVWSLEPAAAR